MATTFDATFLDSLSDRFLKSLHMATLLLKLGDGAVLEIELFEKLSTELKGKPWLDFCREVSEAYDRRYGDVPGY
ncbi:hypothetical protein [Spirosoma aerolatum]|uniref:hypothetical protein n=1 Tax=Spirosoma aerolatum TaxID=1211326 RepID=UPI0009AE78FD|nr:hypothetical protein [Spirosoma aerolatum]